jgi:hypothetical protein
MDFRALRIQLAIVVSLATAACGGGGGGSNSPPPLQPQTISFAQQGPVVLMVGAALSNLASGGGGTGAITYQSSNTTILTVNATSGVATGVAIGTAIVTATKAADSSFAQSQAAYTVNVQTTAPMSAWIGDMNTQLTLPQLAVGKQFVRAPAATCTTPANVLACPNSQTDGVATAAITDITARLTTPAYYQLTAGSVTAAPTLVAAKRFSERIGHAALFFNNRYWVIGGGEPLLPTGAPTIPHRILADIWSSADGKSWKREVEVAPFGQRWFHQAVVHNGAMWVISGASTPQNFLPDVWSSTDGVNWILRQPNMGVPWYSTHLNVVTFNGAMWAVSGGSTYSSTDGVTWTPRSATGAIGGTLSGGTNGRGYASLTVYNGSLWYIAGAVDLQALPANSLADVWKSSNGIDWVLVTSPAPFAKRFRHSAFVLNGRLWVFGGQVSDGAGGTNWALDAWSTTDGAQWRLEPTGGLDASYLAKVVEQTGPERVTLIGGIQRGYSNNVWQTTNGVDWTALSSGAQFSPRATHGVSFNGQLWIVGGATANSNETNSGDSNEIWRSANGIDWTRVTPTGPIFSPRDGHGVVVFKDKLWVIGGWNNSTGAGGTEEFLADVWSSSDGVAWTRVTASTGFEPRVAHDVVVFQDKLWVTGGRLSIGGDGNDVWSSPDGVTWAGVGNPGTTFTARRSHRVVAFNGELWLTGGGNTLGTSEVWRSADGGSWTQLNVTTPFPARMEHAMEVFNNRMYVMGGFSNENYNTGTRYQDVWSSADGITWTQETAAAGFGPRWHPASMVHGGEMWVVGGFSLSFFNDVWRSSDGKNWRLGFAQDIVVP